MSLFPAYAPEGAEYKLREEVHEPCETRTSPRVASDSGDEEELLKSDNSEEEAKRKEYSSPPVKRIKYESLKEIFSDTDEYYIDKRRDRANLKVSTLYPPGRPHYEQKKLYEKIKKEKYRDKRYFEVNLNKLHENHTAPNTDETNSCVGKKKKMSDYVKIGGKGDKFNDEKYEKVLIEKTASYNKRLNGNKNDIQLWIEFVKFQEDRLAFDILHNRASSETSARQVCYEKQVSILDTALQSNPNNETLLDMKLEISRKYMTTADYIQLIKESMVNAEGDSLHILWSKLLTAIMYTNSLCSVVTVNKTFSNATFAYDQMSTVRVLHRYCIFLRQCGLWEQLLLLLDLICAMNLTPRADVFDVKCQQRYEDKLTADEDKIMSSGLPNHTIWYRVESLRTNIHWCKPLSDVYRSLDPQRYPDPSDVADMLTAITNKECLFLLVVNMLRVLKVPLLPQTNHAIEALDAQYKSHTEVDTSEYILSIIYGGMMNNSIDSSLVNFIGSNIDVPNYFCDDSGYLSLVDRLFEQCDVWFTGRERTFFFVWWIRFHTVLMSLNRSAKGELSRVRKQIQKALKCHRDNVLAFVEYSTLENIVVGRSRGIDVLQAAMRMPDNEWSATCLLQYIDMLQESITSDKEIIMHIVNYITPNTSDVNLALKLLEDKCNRIIETATNDTKPIELVNHLMPSEDISLWSLYLQLVSLTQTPSQALLKYEYLEKTCLQKQTQRTMRLYEDVTVRVVKKLCFGLWSKKFDKINDCLKRFPRNASIAARFTCKTFLYKPIPNSLEGFLAILLSELDESFSDRRIMSKLRRVTDAGLFICPYVWRLRLHYEAKCGSVDSVIYRALDECPSVKSLYMLGCLHAPSKFNELTDLILEKQLRLHTMPEELGTN